jgi:hypothetical protein
MNDTPTAAPTSAESTQALCVCDHACPMTEDRHWVNCPAHAYYAAYIAQFDGSDRATRAERDSARHCLADHIVGYQMKDNGTLFVNSEQAVSAMVRFAAIRQEASTSTAQDGYATAFYDVATMLGIGARAQSPADVWRDEMRPKLEALTQVTESTAYRTSLIGRETARADQAEAALAAITAGFDPSDANRPSDEQLEAYLPESVRAEKRCGIQRSAWLTSWFVPWSPRNDNENAEGPWSHWVALAHEILKADAKAIAAAVGEGVNRG